MSARGSAGVACREDRIRTARIPRLRAGVLRLGRYVGWDAAAVARFSETITGRPWRECGTRELLEVIAAFAEAAARLRAAGQVSEEDAAGQAERARPCS